MHVRKPEIRHVRKRDERAAHGHEHRVQRRRLVEVDDHAGREQHNAGNEEPERTKLTVTPKAEEQRREREHARERDEAALEFVVGEETESDRGQHRDHERQRSAVNRAEKRCGSAEAIGVTREP